MKTIFAISATLIVLGATHAQAVPIGQAISSLEVAGESAVTTIRYVPRRTFAAAPRPPVRTSAPYRVGGAKIMTDRAVIGRSHLRKPTVTPIGSARVVGHPRVVTPRRVVTPMYVQRKPIVKPFGMAKFVGHGGGVHDTCDSSTPGNPQACQIEKLEARCTAAGGGMSSMPGGGVDCDTSHWD
jgi:hypothetical protein